MKVELKHQNGFHSVISNDRGHSISIDTTSSENPQGPSPMELLLMGVAGCSSIDIVSILNKQKIKPDSLQIQVEGDRVKGQVPSLFTAIHAKVIATGDVPADRLYRAAQLSFEKYCSVSKTLSIQLTITFSVIVNACIDETFAQLRKTVIWITLSYSRMSLHTVISLGDKLCSFFIVMNIIVRSKNPSNITAITVRACAIVSTSKIACSKIAVSEVIKLDLPAICSIRITTLGFLEKINTINYRLHFHKEHLKYQHPILEQPQSKNETIDVQPSFSMVTTCWDKTYFIFSDVVKVPE